MASAELQIPEHIQETQNITREELEMILHTQNPLVTEELRRRAQQTAKAIYGNKIYVRGLIEFTNYCKNNCYYCGIRCSNTDADRYRLSLEQILSCCETGWNLGFRTFVLQGGEDPHFTDETYRVLNDRLQNFNAFGLREKLMVPYVTEHTNVPVKKVVDPTLLLTSSDYDKIAKERLEQGKYLLLYARRYNPKMEAYAEKIATENGWKIVEISLRATNAEKPNRRMFYEAGVEEFLSLVKYAECVITNSFHGMIFAVQYCRPFYVFSREQCDTKITELLDLFGLSDHMLVTEAEKKNMSEINYEEVHSRIAEARKESLEFLNTELTSCV